MAGTYPSQIGLIMNVIEMIELSQLFVIMLMILMAPYQDIL